MCTLSRKVARKHSDQNNLWTVSVRWLKRSNPPIFCEKFCIVCKSARKGNIICKYIQDIELKIFGKKGCIWGAARTKYYGVTPDQKLPENYLKLKNEK